MFILLIRELRALLSSMLSFPLLKLIYLVDKYHTSGIKIYVSSTVDFGTI